MTSQCLQRNIRLTVQKFTNNLHTADGVLIKAQVVLLTVLDKTHHRETPLHIYYIKPNAHQFLKMGLIL